ncbi:kinase-like domain-containing protein [Rhizophagus irregularis DAOM 181602=DAOM 197198]|nr:kinase-like domain-containing protein [Rhizophagus irregularis DAOM 181602=DAOM 197198]
MNTNNNSSPRLKSSPLPVLFIPFKKKEENCFYCKNKYSQTLEFEQKYCRNCLFQYIKNVTYNTCNDTYLDTNIAANRCAKCIEHHTKNIQEWCQYCSEVSYFRQIIPNTPSFNDYYCTHNKIVCELCDKEWLFKHNQDSYRLSSGWVESILTKKPISILNLPWWDNSNKCVICQLELEYIQQEYCLTTNIIFGITYQSQCKKCKRISLITIDITNISSGNCIIDEFLFRIDDNSHHLIANYINNYTSSNPLKVYNFIKRSYLRGITWIPYSKIKNLKKIAEGGFSTIYKATWSNGTRDSDVAIKRLINSRGINKYFLNELKSFYHCHDESYLVKCYGITQDPVTKEYMLVMEYAYGGNLYSYLQKNFKEIKWGKKLRILVDIALGLEKIHNNNFIHRDIHSGNILLMILEDWKIGDLGLSQPANNSSLNNEIYGVIPYIAPEIFKGGVFSKESDIYGLGMIMWELTTGCKPFANVEHNVNLIYEIIDGKRPEITNDTPDCFSNLMIKCWDSNPQKRPTIGKIIEILNSFNKWGNELDFITKAFFNNGLFYEQCFTTKNSIIEKAFINAEAKRLELIQLKKLGPEFSKKSHPKAIYTSRALSSVISETGYITKEYEYDINNIRSSLTQNTDSVSQSTTVPVEFSRKRKFDEETQKKGKYIKADK